jgi:hypothetical protein
VLFNDAVNFWDHAVSVMDERMSMEKGGVKLTSEIWNIQRKTCPSVTVSTTNTTRNDLELNSDLWDGMLFQTERRHMSEYNNHYTTCSLFLPISVTNRTYIFGMKKNIFYKIIIVWLSFELSSYSKPEMTDSSI